VWRDLALNPPSLSARCLTPRSMPTTAPWSARACGHARGGDLDEPASSSPGEADLFDGAAHRSVQPDLDVPDAAQTHLLAEPRGPIAVDERQVSNRATGGKGVAGRVTSPDAAKNAANGPVQSPQDLLPGGDRPAVLLHIHGADVLQLRGLLTVPDHVYTQVVRAAGIPATRGCTHDGGRAASGPSGHAASAWRRR
jgi:pyruvate/2-oxoglutarate dehydrogenase complex dihydrolipoamide acyltransferase (E2) component